jgi:hypothetical protein
MFARDGRSSIKGAIFRPSAKIVVVAVSKLEEKPGADLDTRSTWRTHPNATSVPTARIGSACAVRPAKCAVRTRLWGVTPFSTNRRRSDAERGDRPGIPDGSSKANLQCGRFYNGQGPGESPKVFLKFRFKFSDSGDPGAGCAEIADGAGFAFNWSGGRLTACGRRPREIA